MYDSDYDEKRRLRRWSCLPVQNAIKFPVTRINLHSAMAVMHATMCLLRHGTPFDTPWVAFPLSHTLPVFARHQGIKMGLSRPHCVIHSRYILLDTTIFSLFYELSEMILTWYKLQHLLRFPFGRFSSAFCHMPSPNAAMVPNKRSDLCCVVCRGLSNRRCILPVYSLDPSAT